MKKSTRTVIRLALLSATMLGAPAPNAHAATLSLSEWGINHNSTIYAPTDPIPAFINSAGFNFTTGLGTLVASVTGAGPHYFSFFVDHEIDDAVNTYFNEHGSAHNAPAAGLSWEIDEPGFVFGDIYTHFLAGTLDNLNSVPPGNEDDASMALGWSFILGAGETGAVTMSIAETPPPGFYLAQTDPDSDYSIYFSSMLRISPSGGGTNVPDAGNSLTCLTLALLCITLMRRTLEIVPKGKGPGVGD